MNKPTLLILAAGMGSRYGGLKQMDPVGPAGEIVLDYSIFDALRAGFGRVVFVIRRELEAAFRAQVSAKWESRISCHYAFQELNDLPPGWTVPPIVPSLGVLRMPSVRAATPSKGPLPPSTPMTLWRRLLPSSLPGTSWPTPPPPPTAWSPSVWTKPSPPTAALAAAYAFTTPPAN